jgi:hypothetical protein
MIWLIIISIWISIANVNTLVSIGANMPGLADWGRSQQYVNLIRQTRAWGSADKPWDGNVTFDPITGWPTNDFGAITLSGSVDIGGKYLLYAKGNADVLIDLDPSAYISNKTYDASSNTFTAIINMPEGPGSMLLSFRNTTGPGLQDIALLQPGYNLTSKSNITNVMLAHLSRFSIIRFMDWTDSNGNSEVNWNDTTPVNWPQYTSPKHNPWQTIPFVANQVNKPIDIWINIPVSASDDYILNVARIMFSELNPTNNIYLEYSNELWNFGFSQARVNTDLANDSVLHHGDPYHLDYDNRSSDAYTWGFRRTAYQIKHIGDLFKTVFGDENVGQWKRVRPILAGFTVGPFIINTGLDYLNAVFGPPSTLIHGIAIAPYFDLGPYRMLSNLTADQVLDGLNSSLQQFLPEQGWSGQAPLGAHAVYAAWYKLPVYAYEGGPDTASGCGECSLDAKTNATRLPRMTDICTTFLNGWYQHGFQELNWYSAGAGETGRYGSWSLLEDMRQETLIDTTTMFNATSPVTQLPRPAPKLKAQDQIRQSSIELNFGIPIPSKNFNATNFMNHQVPYPWPDVSHIGANNTFYYPLKIVQSPIQINITVYTAGDSGLLEGSINNEQFIQVLTSKTANWTTYEATPVMQFNINQTIVPSLVAFRIKNIQNSYNIHSFDVIPSK